MLAKATVDAYSILKKHDAKVVFCVGGFSAAPTSIAAVLARVPFVIHEQNAVMGTLNRRLHKYAKHLSLHMIAKALSRVILSKRIFLPKQELEKN